MFRTILDGKLTCLICLKSLVPDINVDRYHTTNRTATCNRPVFVGARDWPISSMVMVKIYDNGTYIGNSPKMTFLENSVNIRHDYFPLRIDPKGRFF